MKVFKITKLSEAKSVIEYFNAFHDGFITSLTIEFGGEHESGMSSTHNEDCVIEVKFAHHNYEEGKPPYNQIIIARFEDVWSIDLNFCKDLKQSTDTINAFDFESIEAESRFGRKEKRLALVYEPHSRHHIVEANNKIRLFTFRKASFKENL